jgi:hypothetical protein
VSSLLVNVENLGMYTIYRLKTETMFPLSYPLDKPRSPKVKNSGFSIDGAWVVMETPSRFLLMLPILYAIDLVSWPGTKTRELAVCFSFSIRAVQCVYIQYCVHRIVYVTLCILNILDTTNCV